jgi:hypothetical protein
MQSGLAQQTENITNISNNSNNASQTFTTVESIKPIHVPNQIVVIAEDIKEIRTNL